VATRLWRAASSHREIIDGARPARRPGLADDAGARRRPAYGGSACGDRDRARPQAQGAAARRAAAGVPSHESEIILSNLEKLPSDIAILIIEHDMDLVFRFARRITVLVQGVVLVEGPPEEIARDERVHQVYLGEQHG
jgi:hypothetical protein